MILQKTRLTTLVTKHSSVFINSLLSEKLSFLLLQRKKNPDYGRSKKKFIETDSVYIKYAQNVFLQSVMELTLSGCT